MELLNVDISQREYVKSTTNATLNKFECLAKTNYGENVNIIHLYK